MAYSEVRHRGNYFEYLESYTGGVQATPWWVWSSSVWRITQKSYRPTAEQLVTVVRVLEGLKGDIEGTCGELPIVKSMVKMLN